MGWHTGEKSKEEETLCLEGEEPRVPAITWVVPLLPWAFKIFASPKFAIVGLKDSSSKMLLDFSSIRITDLSQFQPLCGSHGDFIPAIKLFMLRNIHIKTVIKLSFLDFNTDWMILLIQNLFVFHYFSLFLFMLVFLLLFSWRSFFSLRISQPPSSILFFL